MATSSSELSGRAARNQDRFRQLNEDIEPTNAAHAWVNPPMPDWVCECANEDCAQAVQLTVAEYEAIRAQPTHFVVAPSPAHVLDQVERVVARDERYWIVEKVGTAGKLAESLDERTDD
jgi:hypothetical protein